MDTIDIFEFLAAAWREKFILAIGGVLGLAISFYVIFVASTPQYQATAMLTLQPKTQQLVDIESVVTGVSSDTASLNTEIEVIRSRVVIERLVDELNLVEDPEFNSRIRQPKPFTPIYFSERIKAFTTYLLSHLRPSVSIMESDESIKNDVIDSVRKAISVSNTRNTYIFYITVRSSSSIKSAKLANALSRAYLEDQVSAKYQATEDAVDWLSQKVSELELELQDLESESDRLRADMKYTSLEEIDVVNRRALSMRENLQSRKEQLSDVSKLIDVVNTLMASESPDEIIKGAASTKILSYFENAGVSASSSIAKIRSALDITKAKLLNEKNTLESQLNAVETSLLELERELFENSSQFSILSQINRDTNATRTLYETFLSRLKETTVQRGLQNPDSRILSIATPGTYVAPNKPFTVAAFSLMGLFFGMVFSFIRQFKYSGFRSLDDVESETGLPALGLIPSIPIENRSDLLNFLETKPTSAASEAIRNLRTSILMSDVDVPPKIILITSAIPGDGKTTQALSLAHNMTKMGRRVLLIDCDIRRVTLNSYFSVPNNYVGLLSVLASDAPPQNVVHKDDKTGIEVVLAENNSLNSVDLFSSERFKEILKEFSKTYDHIILDSPPVLAVPDARIIGKHADSIVLSVAWNSTSRQLVHETIRQLDLVGLSVTGLVLTRYNEDAMVKYGYNGYSTYGKGYYSA